ncbi:hypothetical protein HII31_06417 [Pseudocercospora fuligena]|uniref:Uncharacterized protein n=1 Tax=Pseudocercospora fuligena TaxID=685502 RepID=A0A8H6VI34_9PEZI|nr:hypothetical protein HII31_06417 [Pseudocercospora fuligena]
MAKTNRKQAKNQKKKDATKQKKAENESAARKKHDWQPDELRALYLLYEYFGLSCSGPINDATDEATRVMDELFDIDSSKKGSKTYLYRSTYRDRNQSQKGSKWNNIIRGPNENNKKFYSEEDLDPFRDVKERIEDAAEELGIALKGDETKGPFAYSVAEGLNAAIEAVETPPSSEDGQDVEDGEAEDGEAEDGEAEDGEAEDGEAEE